MMYGDIIRVHCAGPLRKRWKTPMAVKEILAKEKWQCISRISADLPVLHEESFLTQ